MMSLVPARRYDFIQVSAGYDQSCGLRRDGTVTCWSYGGDVSRYE